MAKILLVEDMKGVRDSLDMILSMAGHTIKEAQNGQEGLDLIPVFQPDLIVTDILMPVMDGTEFILNVRDLYPNLPILAISAGGNGATAEQALMIAQEKATRTLSKPFSKNEFLDAVAPLLAEHSQA
ncbi:response regulator [Kiloniella sp. b19]|uniref:response regulator n=1 Tax=Kiloniella sp. GXU_MW_B19 TaxID=3141326 RepID=UPI0031E11AD1